MINKEQAKKYIESKEAKETIAADLIHLSPKYQEFGKLLIDQDYNRNRIKNKKTYKDIFGQGPEFNPWKGEQGLALAKVMVGDVLAPYVEKAWDKYLTLPYQNGYNRRSFRCLPTSEYTDIQLEFVKNFLFYAKLYKNLTFKEILQYDVYYNHLFGCEVLISCFLDENQAEYQEFIEDIINNEDEIAGITRPIIKSLLLTNNKKNWELVGKLLLAAQRQEGLRQSILESLDMTHIGAMEYMVDLMLEHDLTRFSSVVRAVDTWFGFGWDAEKKKTVNRVLECVSNYFKQPESVEEALKSKDNLEIYTALWFMALTNVDDANLKAFEIIKTVNKQKLIVAAYFIHQTQRTNRKFDTWIEEHLGQHGLEIDYWMTRALVFSGNFNENIFNKLLTIAQEAPKKGQYFKASGFHWLDTHVEPAFFYRKLINFGKDEQLMVLAKNISDIPLDNRYAFVSKLVPNYQRWNRNKMKPVDFRDIPWKRDLVHQCIGDRDHSIMEMGISLFQNMPIEDPELEIIENLLSRKNKSLRKNLITILLKLESGQISKTVEGLLQSKKIDQRLAGLETLTVLHHEEKMTDFVDEQIELYKTRTSIHKNEAVFLEKFSQDSVEFSWENGFGVIEYDKLYPIQPLEPKFEKQKTGFLSKLTGKTTARFESLIDRKKVEKAFELLSEHYKNCMEKDYVITYNDGYSYTEIFKNRVDFVKLDRTISDEEKLELLPFADLWTNWYKSTQLNDFELAFMINSIYQTNEYVQSEVLREIINSYFPNFSFNIPINQQQGFYKILSTYFDAYADKKMYYQFQMDILEDIVAKNNFEVLTQVIKYKSEWGYEHKTSLLSAVLNVHALKLAHVYQLNDPDLTKRSYHFKMNINLIISGKKTMTEFAQNFSKIKKDNLYGIPPYMVIEFYNQGIFNSHDIQFFSLWISDLIELTEGRKKRYLNENHPINDHSFFKPIKRNLLEIELERGEMETEASIYMQYFSRIEGISYFTRLIERLGKETLERGYYWGNHHNRKVVFSSLIKKCHPKPEETLEDFIAATQDLKIDKKRWIELALYAPQWANWISEIVKIKQFESAVWFFHAHASDYRNAEKETILARYSQVSKGHLENGAIDIAWFNSIYTDVGKSNWKLLTDACKYISSGNGHRQIKTYSGVILGEVKIRETLKKIKDKRDKVAIKALGLIPLSKTNAEKDLLTRYNLLQDFLKESKQFGAQRQESEKLAVEIGLENLSRNAGFEDSIRFSWSMEAKATEAIMENATFVDGNVKIELVINEHGEADIVVEKSGKQQKTIPAKYKKEKAVIALKDGKSYLKKQYSRTRISLENAMLRADEFTLEELNKIMVHPIVKTMLSKLVLFQKDSGKSGFWKANQVLDLDGASINSNDDDKFVIAHPSYLYQSVEWDLYQKHLFTNQIVQPFKQIFRELYVVTDNELEKGLRSNRYQGHQIQVKKTVALLKSRGWTLNYESGLQKVYHKHHIGAQMYAEADWFTAGDVEAPTIEYVSFYDLSTYKEIQLKDIDPVVFSEVMRDVDLVVSVAHVGDVDPEASHSTMEMRSFLAKESAKLFKLDNVEVKTRNILIKGSITDYSIHLGSGMVQSNGIQLSIIAVQSQHRGRVFLPFIDSDPKSAEIISKMKMLAEDNKIKDPTVLRQIVK
jgi:hypothetical protein